jgi:hypothetical protein
MSGAGCIVSVRLSWCFYFFSQAPWQNEKKLKERIAELEGHN